MDWEIWSNFCGLLRKPEVYIKDSILTCQMVFVARIYGVVCLPNVQVGNFQFSPKRFLLIEFLIDFLQNFVNGCELSKLFSYQLRQVYVFNHSSQFCHFLKNEKMKIVTKRLLNRTLASCGSVCFYCLVVNYKRKIYVLVYY